MRSATTSGLIGLLRMRSTKVRVVHSATVPESYRNDYGMSAGCLQRTFDHNQQEVGPEVRQLWYNLRQYMGMVRRMKALNSPLRSTPFEAMAKFELPKKGVCINHPERKAYKNYLCTECYAQWEKAHADFEIYSETKEDFSL
jgi:hypothetical protein